MICSIIVYSSLTSNSQKEISNKKNIENRLAELQAMQKKKILDQKARKLNIKNFHEKYTNITDYRNIYINTPVKFKSKNKHYILNKTPIIQIVTNTQMYYLHPVNNSILTKQSYKG